MNTLWPHSKLESDQIFWYQFKLNRSLHWQTTICPLIWRTNCSLVWNGLHELVYHWHVQPTHNRNQLFPLEAVFPSRPSWVDFPEWHSIQLILSTWIYSHSSALPTGRHCTHLNLLIYTHHICIPFHSSYLQYHLMRSFWVSYLLEHLNVGSMLLVVFIASPSSETKS